MRYFETFAGVGGIGQGLPSNWECVGVSEIDKYASMVLSYHYPKIKNYGDIKSIKWEEVADFDLLTGGSPCQDFSIAGKRRGLAGSKSSLAWEFIRGLRSKKPRYFIWENVKGVMSSRGGWDFANILTAFSESGYNLWWQVLNAKDFGVPQNRERIFVIGFRDENPKEVFFERQNNPAIDDLSGQLTNTPTARYEPAQATGSYIIESEFDAQKIKLVGNIYPKSQHEAGNVYDVEGIAPTLKVNGPRPNANNQSLKILVRNKGESQHYRLYDKEGLAPTLQSQSGFSSQKHPFIFSVNTKKGYDEAKEGDGINLSFPNSKTRRGRVIKKNSPTLQTNGDGMVGTIHKGKIRKLMPIECERLMSWKDNWTKFGRTEKGEVIEISDSQRYKMCGNGVVSNVIKELVSNFLTPQQET